MNLEAKVRPTFTVGDMQIIAVALDHEIQTQMRNGTASTDLLGYMLKLKQYAQSFQPKQTQSLSSMMSQFMGNPSSQTTTVQQEEPKLQQSIEDYATTQVSPLDSVNLTDDQKYDLLCFKKEHELTVQEKEWFLNKGTIIKITRAGKMPVQSGDL